jgi:hypothetical protein
MELKEATDLLETLEAQLYQASLSIPSITDVKLVTAYNKPALIYYNDDTRRVIYWTGRQFELGASKASHPKALYEIIIKDIMKNVLSTKFTEAFGSVPDWVEVFS